jgi:hypothetical protein
VSATLGVLLGGPHGITRLVPGEPPLVELAAAELTIPGREGAPITSLDAAPVTTPAARGTGRGRSAIAAAGSAAGVWVRDEGGHWTRRRDGHVRCVRVAPDGLLLAGLEPAGVISSADGGESWEERPGSGAALRHATGVRRPTGRALAVTGLCFAGDGWLAGVDGGGAWLSHDGGWSWLRSADGLPAEVSGVWEHPEQPDLAYASTAAGFFRSEDGGASWVQSLGGLDRSAAGAAAVLPGAPDVLLLAAARLPRGDRAAAEAVVFRSGDGGIGWRRIALGGRDEWPEPPALGRLAGSADTAFAAAGGRLWATHDRGQRWLPLADGLPEVLALAAVL